MGIKDCFGEDGGGGGGAPATWAYNPAETYIVVHGDGASKTHLNAGNLYFYNTTLDSWNKGADTAAQQSNRDMGYSLCIACNGKVYSYAGFYQAVKHNEYDPNTDTWTARTDLSMGFWKSQNACLDGATGFYIHDSAGTLKHYETTTDVVTTLAAGSAVNGSLMRIGAKLFYFETAVGNAYNEYDIATNTWTMGAGTYPFGYFYYPASGSDGTTGYIMASGLTAASFYSFDGTTFTALASGSGSARNAACPSKLNVINGKVYSGHKNPWGGASRYSTHWQIYDIATNTWSDSVSEAPLSLVEGGTAL